MVFPSNKWAALTKSGWCVVCVVDYPASNIRRVVQSDYLVAHHNQVVVKNSKLNSDCWALFSPLITGIIWSRCSWEWHIASHSVVRRHYLGKFTIFCCEISSWFCAPKIIKIGSLFAELY